MRLLNDANPCEVHERNFSIVSAIGQFFLNLMNLLNRFDSGIVTSMGKAAHPSGGVGSSNPHRCE